MKDIYRAAHDGDLDALDEHIVELGTWLDGVDSRTGATALMNAIIGESLPAADTLIKAGADVHVLAPNGGTALHLACAMGRIDFVRLLVEAGAEVETLMTDGSGTAYGAVEGGALDVLQFVLERGASSTAGKAGYSPLHRAAMDDRVDLIDALRAAGADPLARSERGLDALVAAAEAGSMSAVEHLLSLGADVNQAGTTFGVTPLNQAAMNGHAAVVRRLLDAGASVDVRLTGSHVGATPAHTAALRGHSEALEMLLDAGTDLDARDDEGGTLLYVAAQAPTPDCLELLLGRELDVDATRTDGVTPLMVAAAAGQQANVALLLAAGADPTPVAHGLTAAGFARQGGHADIEALLQDARAAQPPPDVPMHPDVARAGARLLAATRAVSPDEGPLDDDAIAELTEYLGGPLPRWWEQTLRAFGAGPRTARFTLERTSGELNPRPMDAIEHQVETDDGFALRDRGLQVVAYIDGIGDSVVAAHDSADGNPAVLYHSHDGGGDEELFPSWAAYLDFLADRLQG